MLEILKSGLLCLVTDSHFFSIRQNFLVNSSSNEYCSSESYFSLPITLGKTWLDPQQTHSFSFQFSNSNTRRNSSTIANVLFGIILSKLQNFQSLFSRIFQSFIFMMTWASSTFVCLIVSFWPISAEGDIKKLDDKLSAWRKELKCFIISKYDISKTFLAFLKYFLLWSWTPKEHSIEVVTKV